MTKQKKEMTFVRKEMAFATLVEKAEWEWTWEHCQLVNGKRNIRAHVTLGESSSQ